MTTPRTRKAHLSTITGGRDRPDEPMPTEPLGNPIMRLSDAESRWFDTLKESLHDATAFRQDNIGLCVLAKMLTVIETDADCATNYITTALLLMGKFGLTPSDRGKLMQLSGKGKESGKDFGKFVK